MSADPVAAREGVDGRRRSSAQVRAWARPLTVLSLLVGWAGSIPVLYAVLADPERGIDAMDESHYLMAAQPWASDKAFNGAFGWYSGPLLRLAGEDVGRFRVYAALILIAVALVFAHVVRQAAEELAGRAWPGWLAALWPPALTGTALCYYQVYVRTPSYNWFAAIGLMLLAAGLLRAVTGPVPGAPTPRARRVAALLLTGGLLAAGALLTAVGKVTTALGGVSVSVAVLVGSAFLTDAAGRRRLARTVLAALGVGAVLLVVHLTLVHDLAFTTATYRRVSQMLAAVDPVHYTPTAAPQIAVTGLRNVLVDRPGPYLPLLLLPLIVACAPWLGGSGLGGSGLGRSRLRVPRPGRVLAAAQTVAWLVPLIAVLSTYRGGVPGLAMSIPPLVIAAEVGVVTASVVALWPRPGAVPAGARHVDPGAGPGPRPGLAALLAAALLVMGAGYPLGTNVEYATQLPGAFPVLLAAAVLGVACLPDGGRSAALAALAVGGIVLAAVFVPTSRAQAPYRIAPLDQQTVSRSIVPGTPPMLVDRDTAVWIDALRGIGRDRGFAPGTPMLDLTWHPMAVLVLDGRPPAVLLPAFPGWPDPGGSAAFALRQEDPVRWRQAWILVPSAWRDSITDQATSAIGLRFPQDYEPVGTVVAPFDHQMQTLWKPRR